MELQNYSKQKKKKINAHNSPKIVKFSQIGTYSVKFLQMFIKTIYFTKSFY